MVVLGATLAQSKYSDSWRQHGSMNHSPNKNQFALDRRTLTVVKWAERKSVPCLVTDAVYLNCTD